MLFRLILLLLLASAGIACWQAETRAALEQRLLLRSLAAQLLPLGNLSYSKASAHFWGRGEIEELRFAPGDALQGRYGLPPDFALHIPSLRYRGWQRGRNWPAAAKFSFDTATLPLAEPWPRLASGSFDWRYRVEAGDLRLAMTLDSPGAAAAQASLQLRLAAPEQLSGAILLGGLLQYLDQGLAQNERAALASRLGADPDDAELAFAENLQQWLTGHGLPPDAAMRSALRAFAHEPLGLTLRLDPPGALRPETISQFAAEDRAALLGLSIETSTGRAAP